MTSSLRRRLTAVLAATTLMVAGAPALAHAADHSRTRPHPPHAAAPPDRVAYVQRPTVTTPFVPQRTATT
jgi:hypothetical protein